MTDPRPPRGTNSNPEPDHRAPNADNANHNLPEFSFQEIANGRARAAPPSPAELIARIRADLDELEALVVNGPASLRIVEATDPVDAEVARLVTICRANGIEIAADGSVPEKVIGGVLLPQASRTIEGWRLSGNPLGSRNVGGRRRVDLRRLAQFRLASSGATHAPQEGRE